MAGQNRRGRKSSSTTDKSLFSMINIFKIPSFSKSSHDCNEKLPRPEPMPRSRRSWVSDEDRGRYVGEPDVDKKATDYITRFYEARMTESQTVVV